jgi:hypothetical protein
LLKFLGEVKQVDDGLAKLKINIGVGNLDKVSSSISMQFLENAEEAKKTREAVKANESAAIVSVSLSLRDGISPFEVGEISGTLKTVLNLFKKEFKWTSHSSTNFYLNLHLAAMETVGDRNFLKISIVMDPSKRSFKIFESFITVYNQIHPKSLSAVVELSQSPSSQDSSQFLNFRAKLDGVLERDSIPILKELMGQVLYSSELKAFEAILQMLSSMSQFNLDLNFDSLQAMAEK